MKIKAGIVGAGRIAKSHIGALMRIEGVEVSCVCDIAFEKARETAEALSAKPCADFRRMLEEEKPDVVWICTPADVHTENVLCCIEKGIPFFLEKPVAMDGREGEAVAEKLKETGIYHAVGHMMRYSPAVEKLGELLAAEEIIFPAAEYFWTIPLVESIKSKGNAGGQIVDQATHLIDLMRYVVGEITSVCTWRSRGFYPEIKAYTGDDASGTLFEFESGISGSLLCTYALFPGITKHYPPKIRFICKNKLVEYAGEGVTVITQEKEEKFNFRADAMFLEDKAFVEGFLNKDRSAVKSSYGDALKTLKVCLAANESMETGMKVSFSF